jgi:hypothetical protein
MRHVFVETNWVVGYAAPAHHQLPAAVELLKRAANGELKLYLPSICISESRRPLQQKFQVQSEADRVRKFLIWARSEGIVTAEEDDVTRRALDRMEGRVRTDLERLDKVFQEFSENAELEVFDLTQAMLENCTQLSYLDLGLEPFDQAILSAVLVRAKQISNEDAAADLAFCEPDKHLQPWDKAGDKEPLLRIYDEARIWVYSDFLLEAPPKP